MRVRLRALIVCTTILSGGGVGQRAQAQEQGQMNNRADVAQGSPTPSSSASVAEPNGEVGEIVVTAQKRSEALSRVPMSIQAFEAGSLAKAGVTDTSALTALVPGLTFAKSGLNTPIYTLRGIGFNTQNLSATSPVGVYQNEVAWAYPYMSNGPLFDVQRVEVLKGPQGTLYGRNTTGGLINYITARPAGSWEGSLTGTYGNYQTYGFEGFASGPLTSTLGIRLAFKTENADKGWQKSVSRDDRLGKKDRHALRASIDWAPSDTLSSQFTFNYWRDRSDTQAAQAVELRADVPALLPPGIESDVLTNAKASEADWDPRSPDKPPFQIDAEFFGLSERLEARLSDAVTIVSLTGYNHLKRDDMNDVDGTRFELVAYESIGKIDSFSQEVRLQGSAGHLSYILGGYYSRDKILDSELVYVKNATIIEALRGISLSIPQTAYTPDQIENGFRNFYDRSDQKNITKSLFANAEYQFSNKVKVNGGLRYSNDRLTANSCSYDYRGNTAPVHNLGVNALTGSTAILLPDRCLTYAEGFVTRRDIIPGKLVANNLSFRLSASFQATPDTLAYASIARGFKSGAFPLIPANVDIQFDPAKEEEVYAYEAGIKTKFFNRRVQFNLAGFYYDYTDKQTFGYIPDPVFVTLNRILNIPKSRVFGVESDISARFGSLNLQVAGTYLKSEIRNFDGFDSLGAPQDFRGRQFTFTPKLQLTSTANYTADLNEQLGLDASINVSYQAKSYGDLQNTGPYRVNDYVLANASLSLFTQDNVWRATVFVRNLANKYYWNYSGYVRDTIFRQAGMPRTYGISLTRNFR